MHLNADFSKTVIIDSYKLSREGMLSDVHGDYPKGPWIRIPQNPNTIFFPKKAASFT